MTKKMIPGHIDLNTMPIECLNNQLNDDSANSFFSLCISLVGMANTGRKDALSMLFGLAFLYRSDLDRMTHFVSAIRLLHHPEVPYFLESEMLRVPSSPASRKYLRAVLDSLFQLQSKQTISILEHLLEDKRIGTGYRKQIEEFLYT